jgi:hypothetical protein
MGMYVFTVATGAAISFVAGFVIGTKFGPAAWKKIRDFVDDLPNAG